MPRASTRDRLLDAAFALFLEQGHDATSMDQVRLSAGVSNGSLYHHFPSKGALAQALYARSLGSFHDALLAVLDTDPSAEDGVRGLVLAALDWTERHPGQARLLHTLRAPVRAAALDGWSAANRATFVRVAEWARLKTEAGGMRPLPAQIWSALVFAPVSQLAREATAGAGAPRFPAAQRTALADGAWRAVAPSPTT